MIKQQEGLLFLCLSYSLPQGPEWGNTHRGVPVDQVLGYSQARPMAPLPAKRLGPRGRSLFSWTWGPCLVFPLHISGMQSPREDAQFSLKYSPMIPDRRPAGGNSPWPDI